MAAKLTKKNRRALELALYDLERALGWISKPEIAVGVKGGMATTTLHYTRPNGEVFYEYNKEIGSDLTGLEMGAAKLRNFLALNA